MKQKIISIAYFMLRWMGVFSLFYFFNRHKQRVITYHNVIPDELFDNTVHLGVSHAQSVFENQIYLIKKRFSNKNILITFDDGYLNQFSIASKILEKAGLSGLFFISFQLIEQQKTLTIDLVTQWVSYVPIGKYQIFDTELMVTADARFQAASILYAKLLSDYRLWYQIESELNNAYPFEKLIIDHQLKALRFQAMAKEDLLELVSNGHSVASHGWSHLPLAILLSEDQRKDFALCKKYAEKYCNSNLYSYPYGGRAEAAPITLQLCQEFGFNAAYMNIDSIAWPTQSIHFQLPRVSLPNCDNPYILDAKLSGFEFFCKKMLKKLLTFSRMIKCKKVILLRG